MKSRVAIFIDWYYPAFKAGGPVKSNYNIVQELNQEFDFLIITSNQDADQELIKVKTNEIITHNGIQVIYLTKEFQSIKFYKTILEKFQPNTIYINGIFSLQFAIYPLLLSKSFKKTKTVVAPRGMLGPGALKLKWLKKKLFLFLGNTFIYSKNLVWHATSNQEELEISDNISQFARIAIASNLSTKVPEGIQSSYKNIDSLKLVFISRISKKKNLLFLIKVIRKLEGLKNLILDIYGPIEDGYYWNTCQELIENDIRIHYKGLLQPDQVSRTIQKYHAFVLPTLNENFGHSIIESIINQVPVIISDQTPWRDLKQENIGLDLALNQEDWKRAINYWYLMDEKKYKQYAISCKRFTKQFIFDDKISKQYKEMLLNN